MTTFYIARHGETENNKNKRLSGWIDTPLTDEGIQNATSSGKKLKGIKFDKVYSSDLGRAFITAYIILQTSGSSIKIEPNKELREINYGNFANHTYDIYPKISPEENTNFIVPGGESLAQMQKRVLIFVETLADKFPKETILLVAHDGTINAIKAAFTDQPVGIADAEAHNAHDFVAKFEFENNKIISFEEVKRDNI